MVIKRFTGMLGSKRNSETSSSSNGGPGFMDRFRADIRGGSTRDDDAPEGDTPEANVGRGVVRLHSELAIGKKATLTVASEVIL